MNNTKIILASAYAINPYKGSEDGMGWNFVMQIARFNRVIAITRCNNKQHIDRYMANNPNVLYKNIQFVYFDLPYWMRFWKKGGRGAMIYYWMWQRAMPRFVEKQKLNFDIVHNVNFHNDWTPSYLWKLDRPFVWGPIGHHSSIPTAFIKTHGLAAVVKDRATWLIKKLFWNFSRGLRSTVAHADHILCMNSSVALRLPLNGNKFSLMPSVATEDHNSVIKREHDTFKIISVGRFVPLKGFDLTILSFAKFIRSIPVNARAACELIIIGDGPLKKNLTSLVQQESIESYVRFVPWIERKDLMELYKQSSVFLFPSHEGAGMVVAEALSFGVPVICLDNDGPGEFINSSCGIGIPNVNREETIEKLSEAISKIYKDKPLAASMQLGARKRFVENFHWDRRGERLAAIYNSVLQ
jgi:glycosyltransferase involved in cell wall biosynthesis